MRHKVKRIHFVGIGGSGMSGIAEVLINLGFSVSGSDLADNAATRRLQDMGATVCQGHAAENLGAADVVVVSTAVNETNPEVVAARARQDPGHSTCGDAGRTDALPPGHRGGRHPWQDHHHQSDRQHSGRGRHGSDICHRRPAGSRWQQRAAGHAANSSWWRRMNPMPRSCTCRRCWRW